MNIIIGKQNYDVIYVEDTKGVAKIIRMDEPKFITFDTETTGLHIKKDRPFLGAVCWGASNADVDGVVYVFPTTKENLLHLQYWSELVDRVYCHNTTYDMHMTANIIGDGEVLKIKNWADTMGLCRLSFESVSSRDGGDRLSLKPVSKKYLDPTADMYEKAVKKWLDGEWASRKRIFTALVKPMKWSYTKLQDALKTGEMVPVEVMDMYRSWQQACPKPTYQDVPMEIMLPYVAVDVICTKLLVDKAEPTVERKGMNHIAQQEFDLIPVIFKMERIGFELDREYLLKCKARIEQEIELTKAKAHELAGRQFKSGQHQVIKQIYESITDEQIDSTDKKFLKGMEKEGDDLAPVITRWRTLEKWHKTYICRLLDASEYDGRLYTGLGQFNPVSGRFSGDAQQFPKKPIYTDEGNSILKTGKKPGQEHEIFHPRRAIRVSTGYRSVYYLDFSQVELRVQAHYTLPFGGDLNLCRAYMPFKCTHYLTGEEYSFSTVEDRSRWREFKDGAPTATTHWQELLRDGWSVWIVPETGGHWQPTDVHAQTTIAALQLLGYDVEAMTADDFDMWRGIGKGYNFAKNYGVGAKTASEQLGITIEEAEAMGKGYVEAFPKVIDYQNFVVETMYNRGYVRNLSGRRYYIKSPNRYYKCANYLIQGSCADDLKAKMIKIDEFLSKNNCRSRMVMCIHDEIQYEVWEGEDWIIPEIKSIMEYTPDVLVPIVSDVEKTTGTWADKKKVINVEALSKGTSAA